jgi:hypothetical protein
MLIPHSDFGDPECCGCLTGIIRGEAADIECNECAAVIRTVPAIELQQALTEMELALDLCSEICPHCRKVNLFPGFSEVRAYICKECGQPVQVSSTLHHTEARWISVNHTRGFRR